MDTATEPTPRELADEARANLYRELAGRAFAEGDYALGDDYERAADVIAYGTEA